MSDIEIRQLVVGRDLSRSAVVRLLTDFAEHGQWELDRLRLYPDGSRRVWLRRKVIRVRRTA